VGSLVEDCRLHCFGVPSGVVNTTGIVLSIITIIAIIAGPILALEMQRRLDEQREERNRKLWVFKTLMSFRATPLSPSFVQALNLIDVEFSNKNEAEKSVRTKWKILLDHFGELGKPKAPDMSEKTATLTANLLLAMAKSLNYDFDEVDIKKGVYYPLGLGNVEQEQHAVRRGVLDVLQGRRRIPVGVFEDRFAPINIPVLDERPEAKELPQAGEAKKLEG
jgi:hypothetical protein